MDDGLMVFGKSGSHGSNSFYYATYLVNELGLATNSSVNSSIQSTLGSIATNKIPPSYLIYQSGSTIYARNGITGIVDYSGNTATTVIQSAINALTSGGNIYIKHGIYTGNVQISLLSNIIIEAEENTTFDGIGIKINNVSYVTIENIKFTGNPSYSMILIQDSNYVNIIGCSADSIGPAVYAVFEVKASNNITVTNILFRDCIVTNGGRHGYQVTGNHLFNAKVKDIMFVRCQAIACGKTERVGGIAGITGFDLCESPEVEDLHVIDCIARECWESGFHLEFDIPKERIFFTRCVSENNGQNPTAYYGSGFLIGSCDNLHITDCVSRNNNGHAAEWSGCGFDIGGTISGGPKKIVISNCLCENNTGTGIYITGGSNAVISNNIIIVGGNYYGIYGYDYSYGVIKGNVIINSATSMGIWLRSTDKYFNISSNIIKDGTYGIYLNGAGGSSYHTIVNNRIIDSTVAGIILSNNNTNFVTNNTLIGTGLTNSGTGNIIRNNTGYITENSGASIGTGDQQTVAHGLSLTPTRQQIALTAGSATAVPYHSADPDATNIYVTAALSQPWYWGTVGT